MSIKLSVLVLQFAIYAIVESNTIETILEQWVIVLSTKVDLSSVPRPFVILSFKLLLLVLFPFTRNTAPWEFQFSLIKKKKRQVIIICPGYSGQ